MVSQSTVTDNTAETRMVLPCGCSISLPDILTRGGSATEEELSAEPDETRMLHRYRDMLDDLNDMLACLLRETSVNGHTTPQRTIIGMLQSACNIAEWVNAEERRIKAGKDAR